MLRPFFQHVYTENYVYNSKIKKMNSFKSDTYICFPPMPLLHRQQNCERKCSGCFRIISNQCGLCDKCTRQNGGCKCGNRRVTKSRL